MTRAARSRGGVTIRGLDQRLVRSRCGVAIPDYFLSATRLGAAYVVQVLIHEFGHCLGLYHSAAYSDARFREQTSEVQRGLGPVMSYGVNPTRRFEVTYGIGNLDLITPDDEVGISLLRPRAGWPEATGASAAPSSRMTKPRPASRRCWWPGSRMGNHPGSE